MLSKGLGDISYALIEMPCIIDRDHRNNPWKASECHRETSFPTFSTDSFGVIEIICIFVSEVGEKSLTVDV